MSAAFMPLSCISNEKTLNRFFGRWGDSVLGLRNSCDVFGNKAKPGSKTKAGSLTVSGERPQRPWSRRCFCSETRWRPIEPAERLSRASVRRPSNGNWNARGSENFLPAHHRADPGAPWAYPAGSSPQKPRGRTSLPRSRCEADRRPASDRSGGSPTPARTQRGYPILLLPHRGCGRAHDSNQPGSRQAGDHALQASYGGMAIFGSSRGLPDGQRNSSNRRRPLSSQPLAGYPAAPVVGGSLALYSTRGTRKKCRGGEFHWTVARSGPAPP